MKKFVLFGALAICSLAVLYFGWKFYQHQETENAQQKLSNKVLTTVKNHYTSKETGMIHAYPEQPNTAFLSESVGLYLEYLVQTNRKETFAQFYQAFRKQFLVQRADDVFIKWQLEKDTHVNALIDDVRIAKSLQHAAEQFKQPAYQALADQLLATISKQQKTNGFYADYFDWSISRPGNRLTLSYLTPAFFEVFANRSQEKSLLVQAEDGNIFFSEYYDLKKRQLVSQEIVHMVDQLLIALNRQAAGIASPHFDSWLKNEWNQHQKLYGQYSRKQKKPAVSYESLSVYHYLHMYWTKIGEKKMAAEAQQRAEEIASSSLKHAHFFDYIHYQFLLLP